MHNKGKSVRMKQTVFISSYPNVLAGCIIIIRFLLHEENYQNTHNISISWNILELIHGYLYTWVTMTY